MRRNHSAVAAVGVHAQAVDSRNREPGEPAWAGREPARHVLGGEPALHRVPLERQILLGEAERLAVRDPQLLRHQVAAGDLFGDGMLDLDAAVHLEEEELAARGVDYELHRAEVAIADRTCEGDAGGG